MKSSLSAIGTLFALTENEPTWTWSLKSGIKPQKSKPKLEENFDE